MHMHIPMPLLMRMPMPRHMCMGKCMGMHVSMCACRPQGYEKLQSLLKLALAPPHKPVGNPRWSWPPDLTGPAQQDLLWDTFVSHLYNRSLWARKRGGYAEKQGPRVTGPVPPELPSGRGGPKLGAAFWIGWRWREALDDRVGQRSGGAMNAGTAWRDVRTAS